jgi:peptide/nickel transport system permease protein
MLVFLFRRLLQAGAVMLGVAFLAFVLFQHVGDPVVLMLGQDATPEQILALRQDLGLDQSFIHQFGHFVLNALQGEFGVSLRQGVRVSSLLAERLPATLELALCASVLALGAGIPMGVWAALRPRHPVTRVCMTLSLLGVSLPTFLIGSLLILVFAVWLGWLPSFGRGRVVSWGGWSTGLLTLDGWQHLILPAFTLAGFQVALIIRLVRVEMMAVLRTDFICFARACGLPERTIRYRYALRNALLPVITIAGLQLGSMMAFAIVTESVFQWPGMGLLFIQSVDHADIPVMAAYLCLVSLMFVTIHLGVDLLSLWVDPRLRTRR